MNVLVTGGAGYIGSHVCKALKNSGHNIVVVDDLSSGTQTVAQSVSDEFYLLDCGNHKLIGEVIQKHNIDSVVHMAAFVDVNESVHNPLKYYQNNVANAVKLLIACIEHKIKRFVFSSTAAVYGTPKQGLVDETSLLSPESPYGLSKKLTEDILKSVATCHKMPFAILRYFNVAGAQIDNSIGQCTKNATHLIKVASEVACGKRHNMEIFGDDYNTRDGTAERDFIHVQDLAEIHAMMLCYLESGGSSEIFNCGYGVGYTVKEIIDTMKRVSQKDFEVKLSPRRAGDIERVVANPEKLIKATNWKPKYNQIDLICSTALKWEEKMLKINGLCPTESPEGF